MTEEQSYRRKLLPIAVGMALTGLLLATLAYLAKTRNEVESRAIPHLSITAPLSGVVTDSPLVIRFISTEPIHLQPTGWGYRRLHLHAWVNGVEIMPAAADIAKSGPGAYSWTLAGLAPGALRISLGWADMSHRPITPGASDTVSVAIR